jgi:signal transduction histidine kinase
MRGLVLALICVLALAERSAAAEGDTREEAIAMVKRVQAMYASRGPQATFNAVTDTSEFRNRDLYPFVPDADGWSVAHDANPQMVGMLWISTKGQDGNYLIKEMAAIANGPWHGWFDYKWPNPITHKIESKSAHVERLGDRYLVGVGIYKP